MIDCNRDFLERRMIGLNGAARYERLTLPERVAAIREYWLTAQSIAILDDRKARAERVAILINGIGRDKIVSIFGRN